MRQGFDRGYNAGCCNGLEIWGVSQKAPNIIPNVPGQFQSLAYELVKEEYSNHEVRPTIWPRSRGQTWKFFAAKVPGTYPPPPDAIANKPSSSKADGTWFAEIGDTCEHYFEATGFEFQDKEYMTRIHYTTGSRAIYIDGEQTQICYQIKKFPRTPTNVWQNASSHEYISVGDSSSVVSRDVLDWGGAVLYAEDNDGGDGGYEYPNSSAMEEKLMEALSASHKGNMFRDLLNLSSQNISDVKQTPCNHFGYGLDYYVVSSYTPENSLPWTVARVKYEGTRTTASGTEPGMEIFSSQVEYDNSTGTSIGLVGDTNETFTGDHWIVFPSCRVYLDSTASGTDECWVCAIHKNHAGSASQKIVTGQWLSKVFSPGDSSGWTGYADGTLGGSEVDNVILDSSSNDYPAEAWQNLAIRSYNRVYDPTTGHSKDLLLFTSRDNGVGGLITADDVKATFEGGDLNAGLSPAEIEFETGGFAGVDAWVSSGIDSDVGSHSARVQAQNVTTENRIFLKLTFTKVGDGYVTFRVQHDNRKYGTRIPPFGILTGLPEVDNYLDIRMNGSLVSGDTLVGQNENIAQFQVDNGAGFVPVSTSRIDNITSPEDCTNDANKFTKYRSARIYVAEGSHTISFTQRRKWQDNGHMTSQLDELDLGDLMVGNDPTGKKAWFYNGEKVQKVDWFAWPLRDSEVVSNFADRVSTAPDFITMDKMGRILMGNPHHVIRLIVDPNDATSFILDDDFGNESGRGEGGGGYVRFTASPSRIKVGEGVPSCDDPDANYHDVDVIVDPPWGAFQILPVGEGGDFQVRGANASLTDATVPPFPPEDFTYELPNGGGTAEELFRDKLAADGASKTWFSRAHSWTITEDGKNLRPHVEVLWRPTKYTTAWPPGPWNHQPYETNFSEVRRPRDPLRLTPGQTKSRWLTSNYVVSASYSDARSHFPQASWLRDIANDPDPPYDQFDDPDISGPWPSALWFLVQTYGLPNGNMIVNFENADEFVCDDETDPQNPFQQTAKIYRMEVPTHLRKVCCDFDAVDVQCFCCD